ncbi:zinc transport system permease protein [Breoghania corrubedonensis]|uniref:High-affinity zinc uptake system membrane protein ZnuB n=1 Tax=Breoghania corrubedonensis TaxID=665038 RepID=A0A2T5VHZ2_9HYPH|nr:zinc ABC transporter permease subunit ZnuB [Breoghania corrubedonensis]PTW63373.1 zinc transport system permease protein [Breoghania corrubedonensis]
MLDDFLVRAFLAGIGVALVAGPLGCFIVWRRMAYFGDTMAHAGLLGIALAFLLDIDATFAVLVVSLAIALVLLALQRQRAIPSDTLLGILSHSALSIGLVTVAFMAWLRIDLMAYLFGDILAVGRFDLAVIWGGGLLVLAVLAYVWRPLLAATVDENLARAEGVPVAAYKFVLMLLVATVIAIAMKIVGILLITSLLVIPAAAARRFAATPESMAVLAAIIGVLAVIGGLGLSMEADTPSGPSVVVAALVLFLASLLPFGRLRRNV